MACHHCPPAEGEQKVAFYRFIVAFLLAVPFLWHMGGMVVGVHWLNPWMQCMIASVIQFYCGKPFYQATWQSAKHGRANMDVLIALGSTAAYAYSLWSLLSGETKNLYFESSALIIALVLFGRWLEAVTEARASAAVTNLLKLQPSNARVLRNGSFSDLPVEELLVGDVIQVGAGGRIPVDGVIKEGTSFVDESMLTGESVPVAKKTGEQVLGGTIVQDGLLYIVVQKVGAGTTLARIAALIEEAQQSKAPIQRLADTVSSIFVPLVVGISLLTFVGWWLSTGELSAALIPAVAVLVIACPCALGMATPTVILVGSGKAAEEGIIFRNASALETCSKITILATDKTGTLTTGVPQVVEIDPGPGVEADFLLRVAAACEMGSSHPAARAIQRYAATEKVVVPLAKNVKAMAGRGVIGEIEGVAYIIGSTRFARDSGFEVDERWEDEEYSVLTVWTAERILGYIVLQDQLRPTTKKAIQALHALGVQIVMLTGDRYEAAQLVSREVGIDVFLAEILPEKKVKEIARLKQNGVVGMIGDGINDAPALATADVGFAISAGSDVAIESASVTLMRNDIVSVVEAMDLAKRSMRKIRQNLFFAFFYNCVGIPLAALGYLNPIIAAAAMALSSISVVLNALTLKNWKPPVR